MHWVQIDLRRARWRGERKCGCMDAQLPTDINLDALNPRLEMYHIHFFFVLEHLNVLNILSVLLGHLHSLGEFIKVSEPIL